MTPPDAQPPGTPGEFSKQETRLNLPEKKAMFDWTTERRKRVIDGSRENLGKFLRSKPDLATQAEHVENLWGNVISCFTDQNTPFQNNILRINGQTIGEFKPSVLPTHSEYHISKVVTLTTRLFNNALETKYKSDENALALSLSAVIHDTGSLLKANETGPQEKMYAYHELRAISMVDSTIDALYAGQTTLHPQDVLRLKNKVKMLITTTIPKWNLFGNPPKIINIIDGKVDDQEFLNDLMLTDQPTDDQEILAIKKQLRVEAGNLYEIYKSLNPQEQAEITALSQIMSAADHGAYMLEPCRIAEIIGLWQEMNREWFGIDGKLEHRPFTKGADKAYTWLASGYPKEQWKKHGQTLAKIGINPFLEGYNQSIEGAENYCNTVVELLHTKPSEDQLLRFEGFFSPVQLVELADKLQVTDSEFMEKVQKFSEDFARRFADAHSFDQLSTVSLKRLYDCASDKTHFLKEALNYIVTNSGDELAENGTMNIHIAPYAYDTFQVKDFITHLSKAYESLDENTRKRIGKIILTMREDRQDNVSEVSSVLSQFPSSPFGISFGGIPKSETLVDFLDQAHTDKPVDTVVHFGLEDSYELMETRLTSLLSWLKATGQSDQENSFSIHIDDGYDNFNKYFDSHREDQERLVALTKSVSPLGYLLANGSGGFESYQQFCKNFKNVRLGSHNPALTGEARIAAQTTAHLIVASSVNGNEN